MKTTTELITDAFRKIGALGDYETLTTAQYNAGFSALRSLIPALAAQGLPLWKMKSYNISMSYFVNGSVTIGPGQTYSTTTTPLKLISAQRKDNTLLTAIDMFIYTRKQYLTIPSIQFSGTPTHVYFDPRKDYGVINVWPYPDSYWQSNGYVAVDLQEQFVASATSTDLPDFPDYWEEAIIYTLAVRLAPEYGTPTLDRTALKDETKQLVNDALGFGNEEGSIFIHPQYR